MASNFVVIAPWRSAVTVTAHELGGEKLRNKKSFGRTPRPWVAAIQWIPPVCPVDTSLHLSRGHPVQFSGTKMQPREGFSGRISGTQGYPGAPGRRPWSKISVRPSKQRKGKHVDVDIHDPEARPSMIPGGSNKLWSD